MTRGKRIQVLFLVALAAGLCSASAQDQGEVQSALSVSQELFLVGEPVQLSIELTNVSASPRSFSIIKPATAAVSFDGGEPVSHYLFATWREQVEDHGWASPKLQPQQSYVATCWLLLGRTNLRDDWDFLFETPGHYSVSFPEYAGQPVEFDLVAPSNAVDGSARALFSVASAALFLGEEERPDKEQGVSELRAICSNHDTARYAPYAALALAGRLWRDVDTPAFDLQAYYHYLNIIVEKHPQHHLCEEAFFMLALGFNKEGQTGSVVECRDRLAELHPNSRFIRMIESAFGLDPR